jgi:adenylate kinase
MRLILLGPPGVGKGTQASLLEARLNVKPLSSGVIFRTEIESETELGRVAKSYVERGELVPNGITIEMMAKQIRSDEIRRRGFVLDGFPRTIRQAEALDQVLEQLQSPLDRVISIVIDDEVVVKRLSGRLSCTGCGEVYHVVNKPPRREGLCDKCNSPLFVRTDDQPDTIRERLRVFKEQTAPVVDYYAAKGLVRQVQGDKEPETIYQEIVAP